MRRASRKEAVKRMSTRSRLRKRSSVGRWKRNNKRMGMNGERKRSRERYGRKMTKRMEATGQGIF